MPGCGAVARRGVALAALLATAAVAKDAGGGWQEKKKEDGKVVQELKIEAPAMTEEDQYGHVMPDRYKCDACRAVMFHLDADLKKKHPKSRRLKEWEYVEIFDHTCKNSFEGYGIKLVNGENALSGPGLKTDDALQPGMGAIQMGGETWGKRLGEICRKIVYEKVGEDEVYDRFYRAFRASESDEGEQSEPGLTEALCFRELRDCQTGPKTPPKAKDGEKKEKTKADKAAKKAAKAAAKAGKGKATADDDARRPAEAKQAASAEAIDVQSFLRSLAVRHGLTSDEYLAARTTAEWEKQLVAIAGRIFNKLEL